MQEHAYVPVQSVLDIMDHSIMLPLTVFNTRHSLTPCHTMMAPAFRLVDNNHHWLPSHYHLLFLMYHIQGLAGHHTSVAWHFTTESIEGLVGCPASPTSDPPRLACGLACKVLRVHATAAATAVHRNFRLCLSCCH